MMSVVASLSNHTVEPECDIYKNWRKGRGFIVSGYAGIPQNLILNVIGCLLMILIFSILRKKAWNYGRIALVQRNEFRWTDVFYGSTDSGGTCRTEIRTRSLLRGGQQGVLLQSDESPVLDRGLFNWILITIRLTDEQFLAKSGPDAVQYLSYQRHLIFLVSVITVTSLIIILPINFQGNLQRSAESRATPDFSEFKQSTIINLGPQATLLWVHVLLSITFLFLSIAVMRHFSRALKFVEDDSTVCRTITITGIAKKACNQEKLRLHFQEVYKEDVVVDEVNFAYDISRLQSSEFNKLSAMSARKYWVEYMHAEGKRPTMRPFVCGNIGCCCFLCGVKSVDAIEYYYDQEDKYRKEVELERKRALTRPLGIAFVTLKSVEMAERIISDHRLTAKCLNQTPESKFSRKLKSKRWLVYFAPLPEDIYWENLTLGFKAFYFKALLVNATLLLLITFYTTPVFLLNALNVYLEIRKEGDQQPTVSTMGGVLSDTIPTILLWLSAVTLPSLVSVSDRIIGFWTKTSENRSRMIKTFTFLLFMVIILPSFGLTSLSALIGDRQLNWNCIFYTNNASFFVNYVITSTFLGTVSELMRLPELFIYAIRLCFAKSAAETAAIRKSSLWDFQLGSQYAWMMLIFAITVIFSVVCPVITPVGLLYLIFKHFVDRYNIYFAYAPCKVDKEVHGTAINFVIVVMFLLQIILLAYTNTGFTKLELNKPLQVFSIIGFCITAALFIGQVFFNMCANFSPILYKRMSQETLTQGSTNSAPRYTTIPQPRAQSEPAISTIPPTQLLGVPAVCIEMADNANANSITQAHSVAQLSQKNKPKIRDRNLGRYYPAILRSDYGKGRKPSASNVLSNININHISAEIPQTATASTSSLVGGVDEDSLTTFEPNGVQTTPASETLTCESTVEVVRVTALPDIVIQGLDRVKTNFPVDPNG